MSRASFCEPLPSFKNFLNVACTDNSSKFLEDEDCKLAPLNLSKSPKRRLSFDRMINNNRKVFLNSNDRISRVLDIAIEEYALMYAKTCMYLDTKNLKSNERRTLKCYATGLSNVLCFCHYTYAELKQNAQNLRLKAKRGIPLTIIEKRAILIADSPRRINLFEHHFRFLYNFLDNL